MTVMCSLTQTESGSRLYSVELLVVKPNCKPVVQVKIMIREGGEKKLKKEGVKNN